MMASACLTLGGDIWADWYRQRTAWPRLWFSLAAASSAAFAFGELWMMRAETPSELLTTMRWAHVPLFVWLVSLIWFVQTYLGAGRRWLGWTVCGLARVLPDTQFRGESECHLLDGMSGIELGRRLVADGGYAPFIYLTAHDDPEARAGAEAIGCAAFFRKTDSGADVLAAIRRAAR